MEENMNIETEVMDEEGTCDVEVINTPGPSKAFTAVIVGGIAAAVVGTVVAVKKIKKWRKKKKTEAADVVIEDDIDDDDFFEDDCEVYVDAESSETSEKK